MKIISPMRIQPATLAFIGLALWGAAVQAQEWNPYLQGYHGPYRGRVIDAETKQPVAGAAVVAIWGLIQEESSSAISVFYDAREAIAGSNGEFVLHANDIESGAPPQTLRPAFFIFYPGYSSFPNPETAPQGEVAGAFEGAGTTVELVRLRTPAERLRVLGGVPLGLADGKVPSLMRLVNIERVNLRLAPPH